MEETLSFARSRILTNDDDASSATATFQMTNTLYINVGIFCVLLLIFELSRHIKSIYFPRLKSKFKNTQRVPPAPSWYPFAWIVEMSKISEDDLLRMIGLDGYMMIRFLNICVRISAFLTFMGLAILVPVYSTTPTAIVTWNKFTLANIPNDPHAHKLWVPVIFSYLFTAYYCYLFQAEYKNFMTKRLLYLVQCDSDTPVQTYYTVMVERIPSQLRSVPKLFEFFSKLFPGLVFSAELSLDLSELDSLVSHRKNIRHKLEKSIALWEASHRKNRPTVWVARDFYDKVSAPPTPLPSTGGFASFFGYLVFDAIDHYTKVLDILNEEVTNLQNAYYAEMLNENGTFERESVRGRIEQEAFGVINFAKNQISNQIAVPTRRQGRNGNGSNVVADIHSESVSSPLAPISEEKEEAKTSLTAESGEARIADTASTTRNGASSEGDIESKEELPAESTEKSYQKSSKSLNSRSAASTDSQELSSGGNDRNLDKFVNLMVGGVSKAAQSKVVESLAKEAKNATSGALRGVLEATRTLELLTFGAYYKTSSTGFVTFKSRVAQCSAHQILLSHEHFAMAVESAPNPKDIIWDNVSIPHRQVTMRHTIADTMLVIGAIFWSLVVGFIATESNLESLSQQWTWLQAYQNTQLYKFLNNYLALGLLLILLAILPFIFDIIARSYEGIKLESEIQNSIMTRYFYYQLANVFVSVGLGSIANSIHQILTSPESILSILGNSVPSFSLYFTNLLIIKTFTAVPIELLRIFPLLDILIVKTCYDKNKCTRRELRTGAFADPPMLYGWVYPNLFMVLMILLTYSTISPLLSPFALIFFIFAYVMYKYQLLYVYINDYQSGGFMWYATFSRSMVALICGIITLLCYLLIRETFFSGPFYALLPLPVIVVFFWYQCEAMYRTPTKNLSLESAIDLDKVTEARIALKKPVPIDVFKDSLFRQPSLAVGCLKPAPYRKTRDAAERRRSLANVEEGKANGGGQKSRVNQIMKAAARRKSMFLDVFDDEEDQDEDRVYIANASWNNEFQNGEEPAAEDVTSSAFDEDLEDDLDLVDNAVDLEMRVSNFSSLSKNRGETSHILEDGSKESYGSLQQLYQTPSLPSSSSSNQEERKSSSSGIN